MTDIKAPNGIWQDDTFYFPARVYYEDTDAGGIVYYANYLKFAERARTELLRSVGFTQQDKLSACEKAGFVVRHCEIDYRASAVLDDVLSVSCRILESGGASCTIYQEIKRGDDILAVIKVKVVYVSINTKRPIRIPAELKEKMQGK
ncbi:MAG: tol-pal system-associated acyl-CoA thioesterase [Alphaproteobacteria bacterium]|nr:tol-pal system-associated acyl-CoA thioesterase [Alphaproteobacteria bacterium]